MWVAKRAARIAKRLGFDYAEAVVCATFLIERTHAHDFIFFYFPSFV